MKKINLICLLIALIILTACQADNQPKRQVNDFNFIDQNGADFSLNQLKGKYWIAGFIFTNCETVCPPMMKAMTQLEKTMLKEHIDGDFVLFSVDPAYDSPAMLKAYLDDFSPQTKHWHLLTGYSQAEIETFALNSFETIVQKPENSNQVIHSTNFYLVNPDGDVLGEFNYIETDFENELIQAIKQAKD